MFFQHMFGLIYHPKQEWDSIREEKYTLGYLYKHHILWLAAIPALSLFIGTTQMGWSIAGTNYVKLTVLSAIPIAAAFYIALMVGVGLMAWGVFWMEKTYGADASFDRCMVLTTFTATPLVYGGLGWVVAHPLVRRLCGAGRCVLHRLSAVRRRAYRHAYPGRARLHVFHLGADGWAVPVGGRIGDDCSAVGEWAGAGIYPLVLS